MAKRDFYPKSDGTKVAFLDHFFTGLGTVGASVGVLPADATAISDQIDTFKGAVFDKQSAKATAQAATAACIAIDRATEELIRAHVRRIKAHANYTEAIGE